MRRVEPGASPVDHTDPQPLFRVAACRQRAGWSRGHPPWTTLTRNPLLRLVRGHETPVLRLDNAQKIRVHGGCPLPHPPPRDDQSPRTSARLWVAHPSTQRGGRGWGLPSPDPYLLRAAEAQNPTESRGSLRVVEVGCESVWSGEGTPSSARDLGRSRSGGEAVDVNGLFHVAQGPLTQVFEREAAVEPPRGLRSDEDLISRSERRQPGRHVGDLTRRRVRPARARGGLEFGRAHLRGARVDA